MKCFAYKSRKLLQKNSSRYNVSSYIFETFYFFDICLGSILCPTGRSLRRNESGISPRIRKALVRTAMIRDPGMPNVSKGIIEGIGAKAQLRLCIR